MTHPHSLKVRSITPIVEAVDPNFVMEGIYRARKKTLMVCEEIKGQIRIGMTEDDARKMALDVFRAHGVSKHWHRPYIRFGAGTALSFHDPLQTDYRLRENDPFYIDLGPVWSDPELPLEYEGDYGDTFVLGHHPEAERCAEVARNLFYEAQSIWNTEDFSGEAIYQFLKDRAEEQDYHLLEKVDGHRIGDFPHHKFSKERLAAIEFKPSEALWVLEVQIVDRAKRFGAFFEDLLGVRK